jgi:hypothetical protein
MRLVISISALVIALAAAGCGGSGNKSATGSGCPPPASTASAGNAAVSAQALGKSSDRLIVIRVKDKQSGVPLKGATVNIHGEMVCPMVMRLIPKDLHEVSGGTYKGDYNLFMQGQWTVYITVRSKKGDATTSALPVKIGG